MSIADDKLPLPFPTAQSATPNGSPSTRTVPKAGSKKMLIESDALQTRVAILEADRLTEVFVERPAEKGLVGNLYCGRVNRVLPGMQAAFIDVGLERDAFLYVSDVTQPLPDDDWDGEMAPTPLPIDQLLAPGQSILVQVTKDALPGKGPRVTTNVGIPSRYLVLLPKVRHVGISRRIEDETERQRLRDIVEQLPQGVATTLPGTDASHGVIVRTVGEGVARHDLERDYQSLLALWGRIEAQMAEVRAPALVHCELDAAQRAVRDLFSAEYSVLWVEGVEAYERLVETLDHQQPELVSSVRLMTDGESLFERFRVDEEIERALDSKVWLRSGGFIVINQTEALVAIDVNTGRYVGKRNLEETVYKTNLEAVREIVRQLRLRDLSGIIVMDLIDMESAEHRDETFALLEQELERDRAKTRATRISEFGLVELTRERNHANLERVLTRPCPYCSGRGRIRSLSTICMKVRAEVLRTERRSSQRRDVLLRVHPDVADALADGTPSVLDDLRLQTGVQVLVQSDGDLHHEKFDLVEL